MTEVLIKPRGAMLVGSLPLADAISAAQAHVRAFGVAAECGFGLLRLHADAGETVR